MVDDEAVRADLLMLALDKTRPIRKCVALREMVAEMLGSPPLSEDQSVNRVESVLKRVANSARNEALASDGDWPNVVSDAYKVAAASELIGFSDVSKLLECVRHHYNSADPREELERRLQGCKIGSQRHRQECAGLWIGRSGRTVRVDRPNLLDDFLKATSRLLRSEGVSSKIVSATSDHAPPPDDHPHAPSPRLIPQLYATASEFAARVYRQLEHEQRINKVLDPLPIKLRWSPSEELGLVDHLSNIDEQFRAAEGLTTIEIIADRFLQARSGRLVFLGQGGAGKSTLVAEFALELLKRRQESDLVPVVFNLASWHPHTALETWMVEQLVQAYPYLRQKTKHLGSKTVLARQLVESDCLLPVFDGFDEISSPVRAQAIPTLNASLGRHAKVVLTSRPEEYKSAVTSEAGDVFTGAQVVVMKPLELDDVLDYLPRSTKPLQDGEQQRATKWNPVTSFLHEETPKNSHRQLLREVFTTPFMVMLARATYSDSRADPAELLDPVRFSNADAVRHHLLDAFVSARFAHFSWRGVSGQSKRWDPTAAERWLGFLAAHMNAQKDDKASFAWWKTGRRLIIDSLLMVSLAMFLPALVLMLASKYFFHSTSLLIAAAVVACLSIVPMSAGCGIYAEPTELDWRRLGGWLKRFSADEAQMRFLWFSFRLENRFYLALMVVGIFAPVVSVKSATVGISALVAYFVLCPVMVMATQHSKRMEVASPSQLLRLDRSAALARVILYAVVAIVLFLLTLSFDGNANSLSWLFALPIIGGLMLLASASGAWLVCCVVLSMRRLLPLRIMSFLKEAHRRGVLRQAGGAYQFRHVFLQDRLALHFKEARGSQEDETANRP